MPYAREPVKSIVDLLTEAADILEKMIAVKSAPEKVACWKAIVAARDTTKDVLLHPERVTNSLETHPEEEGRNLEESRHFIK